jgi:hypothetical protein
VRRGNTFMTAGPLLQFQAEGRSPGDQITMGSGGGKVEVRAEVRSTVPVHRVEIVVSGRVAAGREEKGGAREITLRESGTVSVPGWIAARCAPRFICRRARVAAHTSPVYLVVRGRELFEVPMASYLMTLIDGSEAWLKKLAVRADAARHERALAVLAQARELLHERMHRHGQA